MARRRKDKRSNKLLIQAYDRLNKHDNDSLFSGLKEYLIKKAIVITIGILVALTIFDALVFFGYLDLTALLSRII